MGVPNAIEIRESWGGVRWNERRRFETRAAGQGPIRRDVQPGDRALGGHADDGLEISALGGGSKREPFYSDRVRSLL